jgi:hypothetical protein
VLGNLSQEINVVGSAVNIISGDCGVQVTDNLTSQSISASTDIELSQANGKYMSFGSPDGLHMLISDDGIRVRAGRIDLSISEMCTPSLDTTEYLEYFRLLRTAEILHKTPDQINALTTVERDEYFTLIDISSNPLQSIATGIEQHVAIIAAPTSDLTTRFNAIFTTAVAVQITPYAIKLQELEDIYKLKPEVMALDTSSYNAYASTVSDAFDILDAYELDGAVVAELATKPNPTLISMYARRHQIILYGQNSFPQLTDDTFPVVLAYYFDQTTDISGTGIAPEHIGTHLGSDTSMIGLWNLSGVTTLANAFVNRTTFNESIGEWDVSNVTDLTNTFNNAVKFNKDLMWDVRNVRTLNNTFLNARTFNGNVISWRTSSVTSAVNTFRSASLFNRDITGWDMSQVTSMESMFQSAHQFDQDVSSKWDFSSVTNFTRMFGNTIHFTHAFGQMTILPNAKLYKMLASPSYLEDQYGNTPSYSDFAS